MTLAAERYALVTDIKIILAVTVARVVLAGVVAGVASGAYSAWDYYARTGNWRGAIRCGAVMGVYTVAVVSFSFSGTHAAYYVAGTIIVGGIPLHFWACGR
jgi:ascorbate-specific PTS system EIIC-type component UlaA